MQFSQLTLIAASLAAAAFAIPAPVPVAAAAAVVVPDQAPAAAAVNWDAWNKLVPVSRSRRRGQPRSRRNESVIKFCMTDDQADVAAGIFRQLITNYTDDLALEALTEDFVDWTSAVNIIRNRGNKGPIVVDGISFDGRDAFIDAQGAQPQIPFETLNTWHGCDSVTTRWRTTRSANGQATESNDIPVVGLALLKIVLDTSNSYGFRIAELYSEFNSAAWLVNLGVFTPTPISS